MLNLLKEFRQKVKGLPDLLPYAGLIHPKVVLNKDGSFLAVYSYQGSDTASSTQSKLAWICAQLNNAIKQLGDGWLLHVDAVRQSETGYFKPTRFPDAVTQLIDDERRADFEGATCFSTEQYFALTFKPAYMADKIAGHLTGNKDKQADELEQILEKFNKQLNIFEQSLSSILHIRRLGEFTSKLESANDEYTDDGHTEVVYSELLSYLQLCITGEYQLMQLPKIPMYLDAILGGKDLVTGLAPTLGNKHIAVLSIDGLPQQTWPAMLARFDYLNIEYRYNSRFMCLDQYTAMKHIEDVQKGWNQQVLSFKDKMFNNPSPKINKDALRMVQDAEEAKLAVQSGAVAFGYLTSTVILQHENASMLQEYASEILRIVQTLGFVVRVETYNALEAWLGSLPSNSIANLRKPLVHSLNLADLLPLSSTWTGRAINPCPFYPIASPALVMLKTDGSTPFRFNVHVGDVAHMVVFGPTGAGKSTFLALIAAQFRKYRGSTLYCFDKGGSIEPLIRGAGGDHFNIYREGQSLGFAPLAGIGESATEFAWAQEWIESLLVLQNVAMTPKKRNIIETALRTLAGNPVTLRSLSDFYYVLQDADLREAIKPYTGGLFDAQIDTLALSTFAAFEMENLMEAGNNALIPALLYLFHRIEQNLKGQPAMIILDEAWIMLGHPVFRAKIREWLKVLRKANCSVVLATQSLSDASNSGILDVLVESCPTKVFLANKEATNESVVALYKLFGLNSKQIQLIASATPKRDYYVVSPEGSRLVQLALGQKTLAFVGASDKESLKKIRALHAEYGDDWYKEWLKIRGCA